jgi:hypothetical protein
MFAAAWPGTTTAVVSWQSPIVCGMGQHLSVDEYATPGAFIPQPTGVSTPTAIDTSTIRCVGPDSATDPSDALTASVLFLQFVAGTIVTCLVIVLLALGVNLKRRGGSKLSTPPFQPEGPHGRQ